MTQASKGRRQQKLKEEEMSSAIGLGSNPEPLRSMSLVFKALLVISRSALPFALPLRSRFAERGEALESAAGR